MLLEAVFAAFAPEAGTPPPLSLRGGSEVDSYQRASAFDAEADRISDEYLEAHGFWGLAYLDARSWRHYLPHLIGYALRHPDDPHMVVEALVRSLRPPDRYPPRLASVTADQEAAITAFLDHVASDPAFVDLADDARQALDEWWGPQPRSRPTAAEVKALRRAPVTYRVATGRNYRLEVPVTLTSSGVRDIPEESRRVETWGGYVCGDAHTMVALNVFPVAVRPLDAAVAFYRDLFLDPPRVADADVPGAVRARRLDGLTRGDSPAEPQALTFVLAEAGGELIALTVRSWPRDDVAAEATRIVESLTVGVAG